MKKWLVVVVVGFGIGMHYTAIFEAQRMDTALGTPSDSETFFSRYLDLRIQQQENLIHGWETEVADLHPKIRQRSRSVALLRENRERLIAQASGAGEPYRPDLVDKFIAMDSRIQSPAQPLFSDGEGSH
jgi:hypothetical protein